MKPAGADPAAAIAPPSAWEMARQAGLDMELIEDCLALSPEERIRLHTRALLMAESLQRAMREYQDAAALSPRVAPQG